MGEKLETQINQNDAKSLIGTVDTVGSSLNKDAVIGINCERMGRECRTMEHDLIFCDVIKIAEGDKNRKTEQMLRLCAKFF